MFPCVASGYAAASPDAPLFSEPVTIHTLNPVGVVPRSYAPPGYAQAVEGNYNNVAGFLENGNQRSAIMTIRFPWDRARVLTASHCRFYHHGGFA